MPKFKLIKIHFKKLLFNQKLNIKQKTIAKTSKIPEPKSEQGRERIRRINSIIFDMRQLCLNMAEGLSVGKF